RVALYAHTGWESHRRGRSSPGHHAGSERDGLWERLPGPHGRYLPAQVPGDEGAVTSRTSCSGEGCGTTAIESVGCHSALCRCSPRRQTLPPVEALAVRGRISY